MHLSLLADTAEISADPLRQLAAVRPGVELRRFGAWQTFVDGALLRPPTLILLAAGFGGHDAATALSLLSGHPSLRTVPVVLLLPDARTAAAAWELPARFPQLVDCLRAPFDVQAVADSFEGWLAAARVSGAADPAAAMAARLALVVARPAVQGHFVLGSQGELLGCSSLRAQALHQALPACGAALAGLSEGTDLGVPLELHVIANSRGAVIFSVDTPSPALTTQPFLTFGVLADGSVDTERLTAEFRAYAQQPTF